MPSLRSNSIGTQEWLNVTKGLQITSCDYCYYPPTATTGQGLPVDIFVDHSGADTSQLLPLKYADSPSE